MTCTCGAGDYQPWGHQDWCPKTSGTAGQPGGGSFGFQVPMPGPSPLAVIQIAVSNADVERIARRVVEILREEEPSK